ncbi:serine-rich adhesin for platelets-like [Patiria miniata]|uniref:RING-type E3 ubiquitin transferase n=1 Tax=Patiria miniata TaxID=46514 RepID=A0A913ZHK3_PATMI|nr:serine-rich adhesin for platelets-like [Patiria miniata]
MRCKCKVKSRARDIEIVNAKMASSSDEISPNGDAKKERNRSNLRLSDCKCPICMSILIEPVRMPCNHELCMPCFRQNVQEANFTCPMCRLRISNWARRRARENKLMDERRWRQIQEAFPDQCRRRMEGEEEEAEEIPDFLPVKRICEPGAIKQEYQEAIEKLRSERQQMEELEIKKSEEYIAWLQREEVRLYEEQQNELAQQQKLDEELARKMSQGDSPMQEEIRAHNLHEQALKDEEFARKLQKDILKSPSGVSSTPSTTTTIISKKTSRNSSRSSSTSTSSTIKCRRIDTFLSPRAKQTSPSSRTSSKASSSKSAPNASPVLSVSSASSLRASSDSSVSSIALDFDKPSTSNGDTNDQVLIGDPPWGDRSSSDCILEIVSNPASPDISYPSPSSDSGSSKGLKGCLLNPDFVLDAKEEQGDDGGGDEKGNKKESAFESVEKKSSEVVSELKSMRKRSDSMTSTDSISPELNHFRPIDVSPRTSHRRLANGRKESPKVVHTTPRNLTANLIQEGPVEDTSLPPLVKAKFESLIKEKRRKLTETSKATMTGKAAQGETSCLMRQELNKRLHRKPSANRHTLFATSAHKRNAKPEKSPLADDKPQHQTLIHHIKKSETLNETKARRAKQPAGDWKDADSDVIMMDLEDESPPSVVTENTLKPRERVNGITKHHIQKTEAAPKEKNSDKNCRVKRKSCSPDTQSKRQRLENATSLKTTKDACGSSDSSNSPSSVKKSPGKVYRMRTNQPKPRQSSIKQLFALKDGESTDPDHSISPKQQKLPSQSSNTPPLPCLIPTPHSSRLKSDSKKDAITPSKKLLVENCQENASKVAMDRQKIIPTPEKAVLMDATQGSNREQIREQNGTSEQVKLGHANSQSGKRPSPPEITATKAKAKTKNTSPPSTIGQRLPSPHQKTPSKTRRNTIWKYMELVGEEERRLKQEEADRKLALRLQEEFDRQERRQTSQVDRSQGSEAAYELRGRLCRASRKTAAEVDSDDDIFA